MKIEEKRFHVQVIIRDYCGADKEYLAMLFYQIRKEEFSWTNLKKLSINDFEHSTEGERIFVAEADGKIAGFISVWELDKFIHNLFVAKEFRRIGVGQALIEKVLLEFGTPLTLKCVAQNGSAAKFYLANGWKIEEEGTSNEGPYYLMSFEEPIKK